VRITHLDSRSVLAFAAVLAGVLLLVDVIAIVVLWLGLTLLGIPAAIGIEIGVLPLVTLALLIGLGHAAVSAVFVWIAATAFNLSSAWTGGIRVELTGGSAPTAEATVVLPDTRAARMARSLGFGAAQGAGVTSPSHSSGRSAIEKVSVEHDGRG
jgi:hypothetical protein